MVIFINLLVLSNSAFTLFWHNSSLVTICSIEASALFINICAVTLYTGFFIKNVYIIPINNNINNITINIIRF